MSAAAPLQVRTRPRTTLAVWVVVAAVVLGLVFWFVTSPSALATSDEPVITSVPVGQDIYLAVASGDAERTLHLSGIQVHVAADAPVEVEPLLCLDGSPQVTSDPTAFCGQLVAPDGRSLGAGDTVVLRVRGEYAGTVSVDRVRLSFRDGVRWGSRPAGSPATITVLGR